MIAFKEWQVVCNALGAGRQSVILRKGGIHEGRDGFAWKHEHFALFPTRFHAQGEGVKPADWRQFGEEGLEEWTEGQLVPVRWQCQVTSVRTLADWEEIAALDGQHIWTSEVVRERFDWEMKGMTGQSLHCASVEVTELTEPLELSYQKGLYGGCRSWVEI